MQKTPAASFGADAPYNRYMRRFLLFFLAGSLMLCFAAHSGGQAFDLIGPKVDLHVQREGKTLPISEVATLLPGDRLWIHPDFPDSQSARYVLIVAFLRGSTNPPPPEWFTRVETWTREVHDEGVFVIVPDEAQQALVFLAPETGGDFTTLRQTVRSRPGAFVRATQDLQQASWDRLRLNAYLEGVKDAALHHPTELKERTANMARTLGIKVDKECFDKPSEQQAPCLVEHTDGLVLDSGGEQTLVQQLTTGSTVDLMNHLSETNMAGGGTYSPYVGAIVDAVRIFSNIHTARYQYLPTLAVPEKDTMNLRLNVPPSFKDPKSVLVVALPPVGAAKAPQLIPATLTDPYCLQKPELVLTADGAPLIFATHLSHDLKLHLSTANGPLDLPVHPDPELGGFVLDQRPPLLHPMALTGILTGKWGFDDWEGPHFKLLSSHSLNWQLDPEDQTALILDRNDLVHLEGFTDGNQPASLLCVESVEKLNPENKPEKLAWKAAKGNAIEVTVPLKIAPGSEKPHAGSITLAIGQYGMENPQKIELKTYVEAASIDRLILDAGDSSALLKGKRLDEVAKLRLEGIDFAPNALNRVQDLDQLTLKTDGATDSLVAGNHYTALVQLQDGRTLKAPVTVNPPRPQLYLRNTGVQFDSSASTPLHMGSAKDLVANGKLVFFVDSQQPQNFPRTEKIEFSAVDGSFESQLSLADGSLMLENAHTVLGMVAPIAKFGSSAFGPVEIRALSADGTTGDWIPLGTLVRTPEFKQLRCPHSSLKPCILSGNNLFLVDSLAASADFQNPVTVQLDFTGTEIAVPHPLNGTLYLKLRDDPSVVQTLNMPVDLLPTPQMSNVSQHQSTSALGEKAAALAHDASTNGTETKTEKEDQHGAVTTVVPDDHAASTTPTDQTPAASPAKSDKPVKPEAQPGTDATGK